MLESQKTTEGSNKENSLKKQRVDLNYFERRGGKCIVKFIHDGSLEVSSGHNSVLLSLGIHHFVELLLSAMNSQQLEQTIKNEKLELSLKEGVDRELQPLNHDETIKGLLTAVVKKLQQLKEQQCVFTRLEMNQLIATTVNLYPNLEFAIVVYVRCKALHHLQQHCASYKYTLFGNEEKLLMDYSANLRNVPLSLVVECLGIHLTLQYQPNCIDKYEAKVEKSKDNKVHVICQKNGKCLMKCEHGQHGTSAPTKVDSLHPSMEVSRVLSRRENPHSNSRISISSNHENNHSDTSRPKASKICIHCGKIKTERFCECRRSGTPKNSQKGSANIIHKEDSRNNHSIIGLHHMNSQRRCKKCKVIKQLFMDDEYCGECIGIYGIKRCPGCNELYESKCIRCR